MAAPRSYRLVVPDSWFRIPLEDEKERRTAARALTSRVFRGIDHAPRLRTRLLDSLNDQAAAAGQAFTLTSAEIAEEAEKLDDPETIAQLTRLARTQYRFDIAHYTQLWDAAKVLDLGSDGLDKLNQVTDFMGGHLPGYSSLEDDMKIGGSA